MGYKQAYPRRHRAVTFTGGSKRTVTILLEKIDFERLERLAVKHNVGNATLARRIIQEFLKQQAEEELA
jgi:hypothetical protein